MIAWMVYAALVGGIIAVGGLAMEKLAAALGRPRRIAWLAALTLAVAVPLAGGWGSPAATPVVETVAPEPAPISGAVVGDIWSAIPTLPVPQGVANGRIALLAWGAGSLASLAVLAGVLVLVARGRRRWEQRWVHGTDVYVSRRFGPALVGVARPEVVIPAWVLELEPGARDAIIRHETEHARARDHLVLLYGGLVAAAFPWSPGIWWMYRRLRAAVELDCDQRVLASGIGVADYGDVLLRAGSRSRGRWGFAPAMGRPESLLERRLKTMSKKRKKLSGGYGALLVAVAVGAVVAACDTPVPTEVREAFEEVMAEEVERGADAQQEDWVVRFLQAEAFGSQPPLLYVDGVRIRKTEDLPESARGWFENPDVDAGVGGSCCYFGGATNISRIEILKGPAARLHYGEVAARGVIQVFTEDGEPVPEMIVVPPGPDVILGPVEASVSPEGDFVVTGQAIMVEPEAELIDVETVMGIVVTGAANSTNRFRELVIRKRRDGTTGAEPVIYVDGIRLDGGFSSLNELLPTLSPEHIDRVEVIKGEAAREEYGEEGVDGVILVFTKKKESSDKPSTGRSR
ncbi:MAG: TonB-dependent receptor plug domain-containing protein [Gemmatimonadota bacterium]|nr:TonB-dependent receptor plug domain-containing protein [Gemmatimonadota bacterium]